MKHFKKFLVILATLVVCLSPILGTKMVAHAEESTPVTYYVKYVASLNQFRYQLGSWDDTQEHWDISRMKQNIKDGDLVVVDDTSTQGLILELNAHLSNLTIMNGNIALVTCNGVDNFYAINNSKSVVNGDVTNAYVYDKCLVNFNNNVLNLRILSETSEDVTATVSVIGTCSTMSASGKSYIHYAGYDFAKDTLRIVDGVLKTDVKNYTQTGTVEFRQPSSTTTTAASDSEYDDVPKTADSRINPLWLMLFSVVCFAGSYGIKKMK